MKSSIFNKRDLVLISLLLLSTFLLNNLIFSNQLNYGFRDVDWMSLYYYKLYESLSLNNILQIIKINDVYTHQVYYVGLLEQIFGLNFGLLHLTSQLFKVLAGISLYFLVIRVFGNKLLAFLTSILYTISYTHAGPLFQLATGSYFPGVILMNLFLIVYWMIISGRKKIRWVILAEILLLLAFSVTTERMYPLILLIFLVELAFIISNKFKKESLILSLKRLLYIPLPLFGLFLIHSILLKGSINGTGVSPDQFFVGTEMRINSVLEGNWQLFLYPFASFGSIFLYGDWWKYLGHINVSSFSSYLSFLIFGPLLRLGLLSLLLLYFITKNFLKLTMIILSAVLGFGLIAYELNSNWNNLNTQERIHFDPNLIIIPAIFGFFIIFFCAVIFFEWLKNRNNRLIPLIIGSVFSLLFIFLTWVASDLQLAFLGPQRYLSFPSVGTSLLIAGLMVIVFERLRQVKSTKNIAWIVFLLLIPLILINYNVATKFFNDELNSAGLRGEDQTIMKNSFRDLTPNISKKEGSLFYFDETEDKDNGYFDESTVMAGFEFWIKFNRGGEIDDFPYPGMLRTNVQCTAHTHKSCIEMMKKGLGIVNGEKGIWYTDAVRSQLGPRFYKLDNLYAFRFRNKQLFDIRKEVLEDLNSTTFH